MSLRNNWSWVSLTLVLLMVFSSGAALADANGQTRAAWLLQRGDFETRALTGLSFDQGEFGTEDGGGSGAIRLEAEDEYVGGTSAGLTMLASAILPGSGEAIMGYKRGYAMMALDIFAWTQVSKYHNDGEDLATAYYDYADAHYTDARLVEGYNPASTDLEREGQGAIYFPGYGPVTDESELVNLPLYVTVEDDRREYYENLGKWDQFIFGWDDYTRASVDHPEYDYEPTMTISDLRQPWVSRNRDTYREMRTASNDAYKSRDRWMYVNIGLRVFSVLQVAYLQGLLGGGEDNTMEVSGHAIQLIAQPYGLTRGSVAAKVSF